MNSKYLLFIFVVPLVIALAIYMVNSQRTKIDSSSTAQTLPSQTVTVGLVTYKLTLNSLISTPNSTDIAISLDTHSGSLDQNLTAIIQMIDDKGNVYKPITWQGDPPGGHHRSGVLRFPAANPKPKSLEFDIKGSGKNYQVRWDL